MKQIKRILLLTLAAISVFIFVSINVQAQSVVKKIEQYCQLTANTTLSKKITMSVDFGNTTIGTFTDARIKNDSGKVVKFNTIIDALNYMGKNGWKLVFVYPTDKNNNTIYYLFKKEFDGQ
jgi:hypothetical protein